MNQWMNIAMYAIIMFSIAFSTILILRKMHLSGRWTQIVIKEIDGKMNIYIDGILRWPIVK